MLNVFMQSRMQAGDWVRFSNGFLHAKLAPARVLQEAGARGEIQLGLTMDVKTGCSWSGSARYVCSYREGVTGKNLNRYGRGREGCKALQIALRMSDRGAQVPFCGWRRRLLTSDDLLFAKKKIEPGGVQVIELLSTTIYGKPLDDLHARRHDSAARFRQLGFLDGGFHRKGIHVGFRENGRKLGNYISDVSGTLWYVDIDPSPGEVVFSNSVREPLKQEQRMEFLKDHILNIGYRMNEKCLLAYCEGYVQGFLEALQLDSRMQVIAKKLFKLLEPEMKKSELPERVIYTFE